MCARVQQLAEFFDTPLRPPASYMQALRSSGPDLMALKAAATPFESAVKQQQARVRIAAPQPPTRPRKHAKPTRHRGTRARVTAERSKDVSDTFLPLCGGTVVDASGDASEESGAAALVSLESESTASDVEAGALPEIARAAAKFRRQHEQLTQNASRMLTDLADPGLAASPNRLLVFESKLEQVRRNRLVVVQEQVTALPPLLPRPSHAPSRPMAKPRPRRTAWRVEDSLVWSPRAKTSNACDLYETPAALRRLLETDWQMARQPSPGVHTGHAATHSSFEKAHVSHCSCDPTVCVVQAVTRTREIHRQERLRGARRRRRRSGCGDHGGRRRGGP